MKLEEQVKKINIAKKRNNFNKILTYEKNTPKAFRNLDNLGRPVKWYSGFVHSRANRLSKAKRDYEQALQANPTNIYVLRSLAVVHFKLGNYDKGKQLLEKVLNIVPGFPSALENMSVYYQKIEEYKKSYEALEKIDENERSDFVKKRMEYLRGKIKNSSN